jgi:hypothetical protein
MQFELICAGIPLAVMAAVGSVILVKLYFSNTRRMTSRTAGKVVRAEPRVTIANGRRTAETVLTVSYIVSGRELELTYVLEGERARHFPPGRPIQVRYNPAQPDMAGVVLG